MRQFVLILFYFAAPYPALAQEEPNCDPSAGLVDAVCLAVPGQTSLNCDQEKGPVSPSCDCSKSKNEHRLSDCLGAKRDDTDKRLNDLYASLRQRLSPAGRTRLRDAQRTWLRFRDAECLFVVGPSPGLGSAWASSIAICQKNVAERRIEDLGIHLLDCTQNGCSE
jgi:uncharacterized protein YecT (DUF1311 family)